MFETITKIFRPKPQRLRPIGRRVQLLRGPTVVDGSICTLGVAIGDTVLNTITRELFRVEPSGTVKRSPYRGGRRAIRIGGADYLPPMVTGEDLSRMDLAAGEIVYCADDDWLYCSTGPVR